MVEVRSEKTIKGSEQGKQFKITGTYTFETLKLRIYEGESPSEAKLPIVWKNEKIEIPTH